jgi:integrase
VPRPKRDGTPARPPRRRRLTPRIVRSIKPEAAAFSTWDLRVRGLALRVMPTGARSWKYVYSRNNRSRWLHLGRADAITLADARRIAARHAAAVADGRDVVAERKAERGDGTFGEMAARYFDEYAKRKNKSWKQADRLVRRHLLPKWGNLNAKAIARSDVKRLIANIRAPVLSNQILASASAIFNWAIRQDIVAVNPCVGVDRNTVRSRERILSDSEIPKFWVAFDTVGLIRGSALKLILLLGQRPGEICCMRREHLRDGWWEMPGAPDPSVGWPGTKNSQSHAVWLPEPALVIIRELLDGELAAGFVLGGDRPIRKLSESMQRICRDFGVERITPHDLRRTHGSTITALGFGRDAMNRIQNHREGGIASVYDRHGYAEETKRVMDAVASKIIALAEGRSAGGKVVPLR